ncbi:hypothetical protein CDD82_1247 [Ophiocordyceps australis]|uniref:Protein phosphatase methylesterase 1 n=1 Tax=Ophiocordyceps australis TaxID=1399860 RepID=A0A2C5YKW0_9HYPO|nr:hypothetical protein CDD82_1247 [Ophiocordyceps australis]
MSALQRAWAKRYEQFDQLLEEDEQAQQQQQQQQQQQPDDDSSSASSVSSTGTIIPTPTQKLFARPQRVAAKDTRLDQIAWTTYFERDLFLESDADAAKGLRWHAYLTSPVDKGPLFIMHHGAGSSGLSFALVASEVRKRLPSAGILALDCRGHGLTDSPDASAPDLALETLSNDLWLVIESTRRQMAWPQMPNMVLVGHSLGGAVVTDLAAKGRLGNSLLGYAVLDVVEGSAMEALQSMNAYLSTRPPGFASISAAIEWHIRSRTIRNPTSARTSVPALLRLQEGADGSRPWRWRTNLAATHLFWEGWFAGLSRKFLGAKGGKLLLLAGTDRLDTELTIGQMQGKYALQVFPQAGHFIHEDLPEQTAVALVDFSRRNDRSALVLPPKVSELLKQGHKVS